MKNKKYIMIIASIISLIFIITLGISIYKSNEEKKIVRTIENFISNGNYEEALENINTYKEKIDLNLYKNIINDFLEIREENDINNLEDKLNKFKEAYSDNLSIEIFNTLNNDILQIEDKIKYYYEEVNKDKEEILKFIDEDIDNAKELINKFKENYPKEDVSEIEDKYNKKLEEIKIEEEKKKEEEKIIENNNVNTDNSVSNNNSKSGIANTEAAKNSDQIVTVVSKGGSYGELAFWEKDSSGNWIEVDRVSARLGQNGMKYASEVYEMDKCTPTGIYTLTEAFGINANPGSGIPYRQLDGSEYWVDDETSEYYNTMQFGDPNGRWNSAEKLIDYPGYYNYSIVIDYNRWPVIPGKSSAIFLHCDMGIYTYGCVAIPEQNLIKIMNRLNPSKNPVIIMDFTYEDIYNNY